MSKEKSFIKTLSEIPLVRKAMELTSDFLKSLSDFFNNLTSIPSELFKIHNGIKKIEEIEKKSSHADINNSLVENTNNSTSSSTKKEIPVILQVAEDIGNFFSRFGGFLFDLFRDKAKTDGSVNTPENTFKK